MSPPNPTKLGLPTRLFIGFLQKIIPAANPDFEHLYDRVTVWHVEIDATSGAPQREVGLDATGQVLAIAPWGNNYGFIVDSTGNFEPGEYQQIPAEQFDQEWNSFHATKVA